MITSPMAQPEEHGSPVSAAYPHAWPTDTDSSLDAILERWSHGDGTELETGLAPMVERATATIDALRRELEEASARVERANVLAAKEAELGRVVMRAQEFAERASAQAEERARQLLANAEVEAASILEAAKAQATAIIEEAQRAPRLPAADARQLREALQLFSRTNSALMSELRLLADALVPRDEPVPAEGSHEPSPEAAPSPKWQSEGGWEQPR